MSAVRSGPGDQRTGRPGDQGTGGQNFVSRFKSRLPRRRSAFTLIELLAVVAIIGILAALLFPALKASINKARRVAALGEVKHLETAWKKYYQEYTGWPKTASYGTPDPQARALKMTDKLVRLLEGENDAVNENNPKLMAFMEFSHTNTFGAINPWGIKDSGDYKQYYYVKFDTDFDNEIPAGTGANENKQPLSKTRANVLVWTYNPTVAEDRPGSVIGSWQK